MVAGIIDTATGARPGPFVNFEASGSVLPFLLRMLDGLASGDFEYKRTQDGISVNNSGNLLTSYANSFPGFSNDDSDPAYVRIAGSWANVGACAIIGPKGKTHADPDYFEIAFYHKGSGNVEPLHSLTFQVWVSCNGGWLNLDAGNPAAFPAPRVTDDPLLNYEGIIEGSPLRALNGFVTDGFEDDNGDPAPGAGFTNHTKGGDFIYFVLTIDYIIADTLDNSDADPTRQDHYPWVIGFLCAGSGGGTLLSADRFAQHQLIDDRSQQVGFNTRFGDGKTTRVGATFEAMQGSVPAAGITVAARVGRNTVSGRETLLPWRYVRSGGMGTARGAGWKGRGQHFWCATAGHVFGDQPYDTAPEANEHFAAGDMIFRNAGKPVER